MELTDEDLQEIQNVLNLVGTYEDRSIRAPEVRHCSHQTRLHLNDKQIAEVTEFGTITLTPMACLELEDGLSKRGN